MISVKNLTKSYGAVTAIHDLNFDIQKNELFGFIGPDGAGKTTLFRILTSLLVPDSGTATVNALDVVRDYKALRLQLGYMPGRFSLYQDLTVEENLTFFASVFGSTIEENYDLVKDIYSHIEPFKNRRAGQLSGGMKQKLALSCALIHKPEILFLDEPTTGVDAVSRKEFWEMLKNLQGKGITIVVSTPYMDEAELCDRVALIQGGNILAIDTPGAIVQRFDRPLLAVKAPRMHQLTMTLRKFPHAHAVYPFGEYLHYTDQRPQTNTDEIGAFLRKEGIVDFEMRPETANIEDCFIQQMESH